MAKVKITARGAKAITHNRAPVHDAGETIEVDDPRAKALVAFGFAEPVEADAEPAPVAEREEATDPSADERQTADMNPTPRRKPEGKHS